MNWLINTWYKKHPLRWALSPISGLFRLITTLRKIAYQHGIFKQSKLAVPVLIVGNISVGGTGKTPFVIWLAKQLQLAGYKPGVISRGYGGQSEQYPIAVNANSEPTIVGDEPIIIARQASCPVVVSPKRVEAANFLLAQHDCDIIISDDGLQHYALARDLEIVIVDSQRQFGNQYCLPAGPLREPVSRLFAVDFIVSNGHSDKQAFNMTLHPAQAINLADPTISRPITSFQSEQLHAVAGIGNPGRFFDSLQQSKLTIIAHPFDDHHAFKSSDLNFGDDHQILMTEKDAVKCTDFAKQNMWYLPVNATVDNRLGQLIIQKIAGINTNG